MEFGGKAALSRVDCYGEGVVTLRGKPVLSVLSLHFLVTPRTHKESRFPEMKSYFIGFVDGSLDGF
jgi:hypothetical protein